MTKDFLNNEDEIFDQYRQKRLKEIKTSALNTVKTYTNEYDLIEKTKKDKMIIHFYNDSFEKCKIMDFNLNKVCTFFNDIEFIRIDATIAPILTTKLNVKALPFLGFFRDGYFVDHVIGFEGLGKHSFEVDDLRKLIKNSDIMDNNK